MELLFLRFPNLCLRGSSFSSTATKVPQVCYNAVDPLNRSPLKMAVTRSAKRKPEAKPVTSPKRSKTTKTKRKATQKGTTRKAEQIPAKGSHVVTKKEITPAQESGPSLFLFKSEPESRIQNGHEMKYSIDDLAAEPNQTTYWDGVRNAEARNTMKAMKKGDLGFFYHSNVKKTRPGIVGIVQVVKEAYPDHTAFDTKDPHYDSKSSKDSPKWFMVDVKLVEKFPRCVTLDEVKANEQLSQMSLVKRGRISVQRVHPEEWQVIVDMAKKAPQSKG